MRIYLKAQKLNEVLSGRTPTNQPVGYRYDDESEGFAVFVGTERETGKVKFDREKDQLLLVMKRSDRTGKALYAYVKPYTLTDVVSGRLPNSTPIGFRYNAKNECFTGFIATDRESNKIRWAGKSGEEALIMNLRKSKRTETPSVPVLEHDDLPF